MEMEWIPISERLPLEEYKGNRVFDFFIVTVELKDADPCDDPGVTMLRFNALDMQWYFTTGQPYATGSYNVIAWMPKPGPYWGEDEES